MAKGAPRAGRRRDRNTTKGCCRPLGRRRGDPRPLRRTLGARRAGRHRAHFPDTSDDYKGIDSKLLLHRVAELLAQKGYRIGNVDCTIRMQRPKLRPHIDRMRRTLADVMGIGVDCVSVKATTTERLGFEGREEGISVSAVALIYRE